MPQFDTFIFSSSLFYLIVVFFILLSIIYVRILPRLGAILKLRHKLSKKSILTKNEEISSDIPFLSFSENLIKIFKD